MLHAIVVSFVSSFNQLKKVPGPGSLVHVPGGIHTGLPLRAWGNGISSGFCGLRVCNPCQVGCSCLAPLPQREKHRSAMLASPWSRNAPPCLCTEGLWGFVILAFLMQFWGGTTRDLKLNLVPDLWFCSFWGLVPGLLGSLPKLLGRVAQPCW